MVRKLEKFRKLKVARKKFNDYLSKNKLEIEAFAKYILEKKFDTQEKKERLKGGNLKQFVEDGTITETESAILAAYIRNMNKGE